MPPTLRRTLQRAAAVGLVASAAALAGPVAPAHADLAQIRSGGVPYAVYVVKDLGGGAYWNVTTQSLYVVATAGDALVTAAATTADLVATSADNGRTLLLLVNDKVLVPATGAL